MFIGLIVLDKFHTPTAGGLSDRLSEVVILEDGDEVDPKSEIASAAVTWVNPALWNERGPKVFEPFLDKPSGTLGFMYAGAKVISNDPKFALLTGSQEPQMLRDRWETPEQYKGLSV